MAATQYIVFYRHLNDFVSQPVTNDLFNEYEETLEFYVDPDHKIFSDDDVARAEEFDKQQEMIQYGNDAMNPKNDMLFVYNGAERKLHKKWMDESTGYIVNRWKDLPREKIGNQGDFTKDFTTLINSTPEDGGIVVCNETNLKKYMESEIIEDKVDAEGNPVPKRDVNGEIMLDKKGNRIIDEDNSGSIMKTVATRGWYTEDTIQKAIEDASIWKLNTGVYKEGENTLDYKRHDVNQRLIEYYDSLGKQDKPDENDIKVKKKNKSHIKGVKIAISGTLQNTKTWFMADGKVRIAKNDQSIKNNLVFTDEMNTGNPGVGGNAGSHTDASHFTPTSEMAPGTIRNRLTSIQPKVKAVITDAIEFESIRQITNIYDSIVIRKSHIETTTIPAHYEYVLDAPHLIKDTYQRIKASPWFVHCVCSSFSAALEKARQLSATHGIENVKLVKRVPFDHFIKVK